VESVSSFSKIALRWPDWPAEERFGTAEQGSPRGRLPTNIRRSPGNAQTSVRDRTGHSQTLAGTGGDLDLPLPQLAKPFRQVDIARAIDQLIATP
jgi:hypothetical protein